ncbi:MAG: sulfotransferase [Gammaproteobacteria bacterium]|nr:sulfotransferase [Gammaproteobacteria bacterium]
MKRRMRYQQTRANGPNLLLMIGTGRSGTTLAKRYLAEHPALLMAEHGTDYRDLGRLAVAAQGRILVAKRSRYLDDIEAIDRLYGSSCRYLFLVRDPRDALVSLLDYDRQQRISRSEAYWDYWRSRYQRMFDHAAAQAESGHRFALMRYEDLVADPVGIKTDFCSWLGIESGEFTTSYSTDTRFARREVRGEDPKTHESGQVHRQSSGRWRHVQDAEQARLIRTYGKYDAAQRLMRDLGYGDDRLGPPIVTLTGIRILASAAGRQESPVAHSDRPNTTEGAA